MKVPKWYNVENWMSPNQPPVALPEKALGL